MTGGRRGRGSLAAALVAGCLALGATIASAASLPLSPLRLTAYDTAGTVPTSTCTLGASADAYVDGAALSSGSNFGTATILTVRSDLLGNRRAFVRFDLTGCSGFAGARVTGATLDLRLTTAPSASRTYDLHRVTATWIETGITWNNQPGTAASATGSLSTGTTSGVTLSWTVTANVQSFADGSATNFGWRVRDATEDSVTARMGTFASRESGTASDRPKLTVSYYP